MDPADHLSASRRTPSRGSKADASVLRAEQALVRRAQAGDGRALEQLLERHLGLVRKVARSYRCRSHERADLEQEGIVGLLVAVRRFEPDRGFRLSTYATFWIRHTIGRAVSQHDRTIYLPLQVATDIGRLVKAAEAHEATTGRSATHDQLAAATGLAEERIAGLIQAAGEVQSLDQRTSAEGWKDGAEAVEERWSHQPFESAARRLQAEQLHQLLQALPDRERTIIQRRFGLDHEEPDTLDALSQRLGISRERVRQLEQRGIRRLREGFQVT